MEQVRVTPSDVTEQAHDPLAPGEVLPEHLLLSLLSIPPQGMLGITSALLFAEQQQVCAYWWHDPKEGTQHVKLVDPQVLQAAIGSIPIDSGFLPEHVLRLGISRKGKAWMLMHQPPRASHLLIERDRDEERASIELELPGCLFFGVGDLYFLWAVKRGELSAETPLYRFPLPNIAESGQLCFGENTPPIACWPSILPALSLFLNSPFNGHWAQGKSRVHAGDIRERLLALAASSSPQFPEEELVPTPEYRRWGITTVEPVSLETHLKYIVQYL